MDFVKRHFTTVGLGRLGWYAAAALVRIAALAMTGWSLYTVARHYGAPAWTAASSAAVFDGIAVAALHLASEASGAGRSAAGARLTAVLMAGVSVYLNDTHAALIHQGAPAAVLFSAPTVGMLLLSELSWAGPRAAQREARGDRPFRLPAFGGWAWLLSFRLAAHTVRWEAQQFIINSQTPAAEVTGAAPDITVTRPDTVTEPAVAVTAEPERPALTSTVIAPVIPADLTGYRPASLADGVRALLDHGVTDRDAVVGTVVGWLGEPKRTDSVRRAYDREVERRSRAADAEVGQGGGGYA